MGSDLILIEPILNQRAVIAEMIQDFALLAESMHWAPIDFHIEAIPKNYIDL